MGTSITCSGATVIVLLHEFHQLPSQLRHRHIENLHVRQDVNDVQHSVPLDPQLRPLRLQQQVGPPPPGSSKRSKSSGSGGGTVVRNAAVYCVSRSSSLVLAFSGPVGRCGASLLPGPSRRSSVHTSSKHGGVVLFAASRLQWRVQHDRPPT